MIRAFGVLLAAAAVCAVGGCGAGAWVDTERDAGPVLVRTIVLPTVGGAVERNGIGGRLDHMAYDAVTGRLFLAAFSKGSLEVIDLDRGVLVRSIEKIPEAQGVAVVRDVVVGVKSESRVFVSAGADGVLHAFDTTTLEEVGKVTAVEDADNVRFDARSGYVLVGGGSKTAGEIVAVDPATMTLVGSIGMPGHVESFQCEAEGRLVYANVPGDKASDRSGVVVVADRVTGERKGVWELFRAARNFAMALDAARGRVFVVTRKPAKVVMLDVATGRQLGEAGCIADCDDVFWVKESGELLVIGGGRRVSDRAGAPVEADQPGALQVFAVNESGELVLRASEPLPPQARTGLYVPERGMVYVAVPVLGERFAEVREYRVGGAGR